MNSDNINSSFTGDVYKCQALLCNRQYKTEAGFTKHILNAAYNNTYIIFEHNRSPDEPDLGEAESIINLLLLMRDLWNAYEYADSDRIFIDIKYVFLHLCSSGHIKYKQWLWRMLAYEKALLSH